MKKVIAFAVIFAAALMYEANANPSPENFLSEYSTSPPWIEIIYFYDDSLNLSGTIIGTSGGNAVVDSGVFARLGQPLVLDSSNTSGFVLNPEGDSLTIPDLFLTVRFGCRGSSGVPPLPRESAAWSDYGYWGVLNFCTTPSPGENGFAPRCDWGETDIVISEINSAGNWAPACNFVELANRLHSPVDISGWQIICNSRYVVPEGTFIPARGFFVLDETEFPEDFAVSPNCDNIYLLNNQGWLVDQVGWSSDHGQNVSFMRSPFRIDNLDYYHFWGYDDFSSYSFSMGFPARGAFNRYQSPGLKVIGTRADTAGGMVNICWTNPIWFPAFDRAVLRRSATFYPLTPAEGQMIYEGSAQEFLGDAVPAGQTAYYTVFARTANGTYSSPDTESMAIVHMSQVGINDEPLPESPLLLACYPNPFNASVTIEFASGNDGTIDLSIYNIVGQKVAVLAAGAITTGRHRVVWDATEMPSGPYFVRLYADEFTETRKMTLLK